MSLLKFLFGVCTTFTLLILSTLNMHAYRNPKEPDNEIKIGLLIPDNKFLSARHGAEMALLEANQKGGLNGRPFQLVVRSMEGPWGTGSKQAVDLIFNEEVLAIIGSHDGRNAHLVEQVSAKARIVFLSAWASDPTLSKAFVPWYFSCVPNDLQQADALVDEICNKRNLDNIAAVSDSGYDAKLAINSFLKKTRIAGKHDPVVFYYDQASQNFDNLIRQLEEVHARVVVLFGQPPASLKIIRQMRLRKMQQPIFGTLSVSGENDSFFHELTHVENIVLVSSGQSFSSKGPAFRQEFQRLYGYRPDAVSAYAYDAVNLIIEAIKKTGPDRDKIQKSLVNMKYEGVTGMIHFDDRGNRLGSVCLMEIRKGLPVAPGKH
jgi:branched-chain amino acid transport system substrate-binding protein